MSKLLAGFPDVENVVCQLLEQVAPTVTRAPDPLPERIILVNRIGGPNDQHTDYPIVQVSVLASATVTQPTPRDVAWQLAEQCRQIILAAGRTEVDGTLIDSAETITPVVLEADENPDVRRVAATYEFEFRRPRQR